MMTKIKYKQNKIGMIYLRKILDLRKKEKLKIIYKDSIKTPIIYKNIVHKLSKVSC